MLAVESRNSMKPRTLRSLVAVALLVAGSDLLFCQSAPAGSVAPRRPRIVPYLFQNRGF